MPIQIEDYSQRSAASELAKAGIAGALAFTATEAGGKIIESSVLGAWGGFKKVAPSLGRVAWGTAKFAGRYAKTSARIYNGGMIRGVIGGTGRSVINMGSWLYKNPVAGSALIGATAAVAGGTAAMVDYDNRLTSEKYVSPGIVESMGGTTNYGTRHIMNTINAQGSMVFGMNNRR